MRLRIVSKTRIVTDLRTYCVRNYTYINYYSLCAARLSPVAILTSFLFLPPFVVLCENENSCFSTVSVSLPPVSPAVNRIGLISDGKCPLWSTSFSDPPTLTQLSLNLTKCNSIGWISMSRWNFSLNLFVLSKIRLGLGSNENNVDRTRHPYWDILSELLWISSPALYLTLIVCPLYSAHQDPKKAWSTLCVLNNL
jgi:hypothetical protein